MYKRFFILSLAVLVISCAKKNDDPAASPASPAPVPAPAKPTPPAVTTSICPTGDIVGVYKSAKVTCTLSGKPAKANPALVPAQYQIKKGELHLTFAKGHTAKNAILKFPDNASSKDFTTSGTQCVNQVVNGKMTKSLAQFCSDKERTCTYTFAKVENEYTATLSTLIGNQPYVCHQTLR